MVRKLTIETGTGSGCDVSHGVRQLLGKGVYGFAEASRLAGVDSVNTRRWFLGRSDADSGPVLHSDIPPVGNRHAVSFLDLIDLRIVGQFRRFGITMPTIRAVYAKLGHEVGTRHAFAHADLCVCGKTVLRRMVDEDGVEELREVITGQHAMPRILEKFLRDIEYGRNDGLAARWNIHPGVVVDPNRNLGKPISGESGAGTYVLAHAYAANDQDADLVADLFGTSAQAVRDAVAFERRFGSGGRRAGLMDFFMDRNVGVKMARLIEAFDRESQVRHLDDDFEHDTPDTVWIHALGKRTPKPVVVGGDARILRNEAEMQTLREAGLTYFLLAKGWINLNWREKQAWMMIKVWPQIVANATPTRPTIYEVTVNLKVERLYATEELGRSSRR